MKVRPFLVMRLLSDSDSAVRKDMDVFFPLETAVLRTTLCPRSSGRMGAESSVTTPSSRRTIRVEYCSASWGLCVTIITSLSLAISFRISMIWMLVAVSSAPVGSSASRISGSLTMARAMATRCICPPDIWLGFFFIWSPNPTRRSASSARRRRSALDTPESVSANSTFASTVWCGIRL